MTDIMGEITAASQEQTAGIEQINQAITQMDAVTQQNAALVEEAAAAAESLQDQAANLSQVVSVFTLDDQRTVLKPVTVAGAAPRRQEKAALARRIARPAPRSAIERAPAAPRQKMAAPAPQKIAAAPAAGGDWEEF